MLEQSHKMFLILLLGIQVLSFPLDSFIYEANPIQRISLNYDDTNSTKPLKFKLQTVAFTIYEQLDGLNSNNLGDNKRKIINDLTEIEEKYKKLSRFTVFYNSEDNVPNDAKPTNDTNSKLKTIGTVNKNMTSSIKVNEKSNLEKEKHTASSTVRIVSTGQTVGPKQLNTVVTTEFDSSTTTETIEYNPTTDINFNFKPNDSLDNEMTTEVDYPNETMSTSETPTTNTVQ